MAAAGVTKQLLLLTFLSAIGGFLFGYDTGVISSAMLLIEKDPRMDLNTVWTELIVSATVRFVLRPFCVLHEMNGVSISKPN